MQVTDFSFFIEIKRSYLNLRTEGASRCEAVEKLKADYGNEIELAVEDDALLFWIALADAQYANKELSADVAEKAIDALGILAQSEWRMDAEDIVERKKKYQHAPMCERKMHAPRRKFRCSWKNGDTFLYRLLTPHSDETGMPVKYMLIRKMSDIEFGDGRLLPVVTLTLWKKDTDPENLTEIATIPPIKINRGRMGLPLDRYEYRTELIVDTVRQLEKLGLVYLGNISNQVIPDDEIVIDDPGKMTMTVLSNFDHQLSIYINRSQFYEKEIGAQPR